MPPKETHSDVTKKRRSCGKSDLQADRNDTSTHIYLPVQAEYSGQVVANELGDVCRKQAGTERIPVVSGTVICSAVLVGLLG